MDKVFQVFISSTFADLKEERQQVSNALAKAGYIAAGMELFPAADQEQFEYIKRIVDRSDYYVVILGGRYGSLADDNVSFTEKEFDYAKSKGIPVLAFLHRNPRKLAVEKTDDDKTKAEQLRLFRNRLQTGRLVEFWDEASDLCMKVIIAVANAANLNPGIGWVRGDQAIDPKVLQETEKLRIENQELRRQISDPDGLEVSFSPDISGPDNSIDIDATIHWHSPKGVKAEKTPVKITVLLGDLFLLLHDDLLHEPSEGSLRHLIGKVLASMVPDVSRDLIAVEVDGYEITKLRHQFEAMMLVTVISASDGGVMQASILKWLLTDKGRKFAIKRRAQKTLQKNVASITEREL